MSSVFIFIISINIFQVVNGLSLTDIENKNSKANLKIRHNKIPSINYPKITSNELLKKWYSQYSINDDDTPLPGDPPVKGLTDVAIREQIGVGYGVGSFGYLRDFGVGTGISGRSGGQLYGYGSNLFPNVLG
uniref:Uncharacterized protein n=1 Tax=Strongyloides stercoralis TaxID=6248 RepID=A0A0K0EJE0_STRER